MRETRRYQSRVVRWFSRKKSSGRITMWERSQSPNYFFGPLGWAWSFSYWLPCWMSWSQRAAVCNPSFLTAATSCALVEKHSALLIAYHFSCSFLCRFPLSFWRAWPLKKLHLCVCVCDISVNIRHLEIIVAYRDLCITQNYSLARNSEKTLLLRCVFKF